MVYIGEIWAWVIISGELEDRYTRLGRTQLRPPNYRTGAKRHVYCYVAIIYHVLMWRLVCRLCRHFSYGSTFRRLIIKLIPSRISRMKSLKFLYAQ